LLSKNEKENLAKIFKALDKNGDGKLSKDEIINGYAELFGKNLHINEVDLMFE